MSLHLIAASVAALLMSATTIAVAQTAAPAPAPMAAPAPAAAPARASTAAVDTAEGKVAYYGRKFAGRKTASGERFNPQAMTMAHKTLPFGTMVRVTNVRNNKSVVVRVNDRGPSQPDRMGDLTVAAARKIGMTREGIANVRFEVVGQGKRKAATMGKPRNRAM